MDTCTRYLRVESIASPFFKVVPVQSSKGSNAKKSGKVAAGMEVQYMLEFYPHEIFDYRADIICCTDREKFVVPIRTRGTYAALDIPDSIQFTECPVKLPSSKVMTIRNTGSRTATFSFSVTHAEHFSVSPRQCFLESKGIGVQIEIICTPTSLECEDGELIITDDSGQIIAVELSAVVQNLDVYLSQSTVDMAATYITLQSRKHFKICNESDYPLAFTWKSFHHECAEEEEITRLIEDINQNEILELHEMVTAREVEDEIADMLTNDASNPFDARNSIENKYNQLRRAVMNNQMEFTNAHITIEPISGTVWAQSYVDVLVSFSPKMTHVYSTNAYLDILGRDRRLPLKIRGKGIGPKIKICQKDVLDFGKILINEERSMEFTMQNQGDIQACFEIIPFEGLVQCDERRTCNAKTRISIFPSTGTLEVKEYVKITVLFCSKQTGERNDTVRFRLQGSDRCVMLRIKASVIQPDFSFDQDRLDFGIVSYSFLQMESLKLSNYSTFTYPFTIMICGEDKHWEQEFLVSPSDGIIKEQEELRIEVKLTPLHLKRYEYTLYVRIKDTDWNLLAVPVRAQCLVPEVYIENDSLSFNDCFIHYPHEQTLILCNRSSSLDARYELKDQNEESTRTATCRVSSMSGIILRDERIALKIYLSCEKLGSIRIPLQIQITGSPLMPLVAFLTALSIGPRVDISPQEIKFGNSTCLLNHSRKLELKNDSPIPAPFKALLKNQRSRFSISEMEGVMAPNKTCFLEVSAMVDDTILCKDALQITILDGATLLIPLSIRGIGSTIWCSSDLREIDCGSHFTGTECEYTFKLENRGKRAQIIAWGNKTTNIRALAPTTDLRNHSKSRSGEARTTKKTGNFQGKPHQDSASNISVFSVFPTSTELQPRASCIFIIKGISAVPGTISEELVCDTRVGKEKINRPVFVSKVIARFLHPSVEASDSHVTFTYIHNPLREGTVAAIEQTEDVSFKNSCSLPTTIYLRAQPPFNLSVYEVTLPPSESLTVQVVFDPGYRGDFISHHVDGKIYVNYRNHAKREVIDLNADVFFPNISFETMTIDFGCALNETRKSQVIQITNSSSLVAKYRWVLVEEKRDELGNTNKDSIPINQVFDILPNAGALEPNACESVEFLYHGHSDRKFKCSVACIVEGGPEYMLSLQGEASSVSYKLDKHFLDLGSIYYNRSKEGEFSIVNTGKVTIPFKCRPSETQILGGSLEIIPCKGKIHASEKQKIIIRVSPGIPRPFVQVVWLEIAYFEPIEFKIFACGTFSTWSSDLPREPYACCSSHSETFSWSHILQEAQSNLLKAAQQKLDAMPNSRPVNELLAIKASTESLPSIASASSRRTTRFGTTRSAAPSSNDYDLELESSRILFEKHLTDMRDIEAIHASGSVSDVDSNPNQSTLTRKVNSKSLEDKRNTQSKSSLSSRDTLNAVSTLRPFVLNHFVLDFGTVVPGSHKLQSFTLTNTGQVPASFQVDKKMASTEGFEIEPERVIRLPELHSVDISVTFQARKALTLGMHEVVIPVSAKGEPANLISVRGCISLPEIAMSSDMLDFGKVMVGCGKTIYTQLHNPANVIAEWTIKKPVGVATNADTFKISPLFGVLNPNAKVNIEVSFEPRTGGVFAKRFPLQLTASPKVKTITCRGEGSEIQITFSPSLVELGPTLQSLGKVEMPITLCNASEHVLEIVSLDFDEKFRLEEELLASIEAFDASTAPANGRTIDVLRLSLRSPGQTMQEYLAKHNLYQNSSTSMHPLAVKGSEDRDEGASASIPIDTNISIKRRHSRALDYIILGPPQSGKSAQCRLLGDRENLVVWSLQESIETIRNKIVTDADRDEGERQALTQILSGLTSQNVAQDDLDSTVDNSSDDRFVNSVVTDKIEKGSTFSIMLTRAIEWRLSQPDMQNGSIMDGIDTCPFASYSDILKALKKVSSSIRVILLHFDSDTFSKLQEWIHQTDAHHRSNKSLKLPQDLDIIAKMTSNISIFEEYNASTEERCNKIREICNTEKDTDRTNDDSIPKEQNDCTSTSQSCALPNSNNLLIEVHITEIGPLLFIHNILVTQVEQQVKKATALQIPPTKSYQLVHRPLPRNSRRPVAHFTLGEADKSSENHSEGNSLEETTFGHIANTCYRWILSPSESIQLCVAFSADDIGEFESTLGFEVVGFQREFSVLCRASTSVPSLNRDPRNIYMRRIKSRPDNAFVSKKYVISRDQFEFGPLNLPTLRPKPSTSDLWQELFISTKQEPIVSRQRNVELFRLSNSSIFPAYVAFAMLGKASTDPVFSVYPTSLRIPEGETAEVLVLAHPTKEGIFEDRLICCICDNPEPIILAFTCFGCNPSLTLRGPWKEATDVDDMTHDPATFVLDFDRILLQRTDKRTIQMENTCAIDLKWRIPPAESGSEFQISPIEGIVKANGSELIDISFMATNESVNKDTIRIEYTDKCSTFDHNDKVQHLNLILQAESYAIHVCSFEKMDAEEPSDGVLDFGLLRVGEAMTKSFRICNRGKYDIKYIMKIRKAKIAKLFTIDPLEAIVPPGDSSEISVHFRSQHEVTLQECNDIRCTIVEMISQEISHQFGVLISARTVFSRFRIQPSRGINFGPHAQGNLSVTKQVGLRNDGEFAFHFQIRPAPASDAEVAALGAIGSEVEIADAAILELGPFQIQPCGGTVDPGATTCIEVAFTPQKCHLYRQLLQIDISGYNIDTKESQKAHCSSNGHTQYEIVAESCQSSIVTNDFECIFEEHMVLQTLLGNNTEDNPVYSSALIQHQSGIYATKENIFYFGTKLACNTSKGSTVRFKIINPTKVNATVRFQIRHAQVQDFLSSETLQTMAKAFTVQPSEWDIPPHEYRFINVHFKPTVIMSYRADFVAHVDQRDDSSMSPDLQFELNGEGSLPCISVLEPIERDPGNSTHILCFDRVQVHKTRERTIVLKNDGVLPATAILSMQNNSNFTSSLLNKHFTVAPRQTENITIQFKPLVVHEQPILCEVKLTVQNNPYDESSIILKGSGYMDDIAFDDLPFFHDSELHFNDIILGHMTKSGAMLPTGQTRDVKVFSLHNQRSHLIRFTWPQSKDFTFSPEVGHLSPNATKTITASFNTDDLPYNGSTASDPETGGASNFSADLGVSYTSHVIPLQLQRIAYKETVAEDRNAMCDWDSCSRLLQYQDDSTAIGDDATGTLIYMVEPEYKALEAVTHKPLSCFASADVIHLNFSASKLAFKPTFMLQSCTYKISVENKSKVHVDFSWCWIRRSRDDKNSSNFVEVRKSMQDEYVSLSTSPDNLEECPFYIVPESGTIPPNTDKTFSIFFAPMEVGEYLYDLAFHEMYKGNCEKDDNALEAPAETARIILDSIEIRATSLRPVCHFELERSEYHRRRPHNLKGPHGETGALDSSIQVIEMETIGVKVRNSKKFHVINPTNATHEFAWVSDGEPNSSFRCVTSRGLILPGKQYEMIFEFYPQTLELQESFWHFKIAQYQLDQCFLLVGIPKEPRVSFDRGNVHFNTIMLNSKSVQTVSLVNIEQIPFNFVFDKASSELSGEHTALAVHPVSGVLAPQSKLPIDIEFCPTEEKLYSFKLQCLIKRKSSKLSLNVKAEGYAIHETVLIYGAKAAADHQKNVAMHEDILNDSIVAKAKQLNHIDFGTVQLYQEDSRIITIQNSGRFPLDYQWMLLPQSGPCIPAKASKSSRFKTRKHGSSISKAIRHAIPLNVGSLASQCVSIEPAQGTIKKDDNMSCHLRFKPTKETFLNGILISCCVSSSVHYVFSLRGSAVPPSVQFSTTLCNFGPCFISDTETLAAAETLQLIISNTDPTSAIEVDCVFENKPHLHVDTLVSTVIPPGKSIPVSVIFIPRQEITYMEPVSFMVNNSFTVTVIAQGEGIYPKIELSNASMQTLAFGSARIGQVIVRNIRLANRCKRGAVLSLVEALSETDDTVSLASLAITHSKPNQFSMRPKETVDIDFKFAPTHRIPFFSKTIALEVAGSTRTLTTLTGCCLGMDVRIDSDTISFGTVCLGSQLSRKIRLQNAGDIAAKFHWNANDFSPHFTIDITDGIVAAGCHKTLEVLFRPKVAHADLRLDRIVCSIIDCEPLYLTLIGQCTAQPPSSIIDLRFESRVRERTSQTVTIANETSDPWNLTVVLQGEHWACPKFLAVPANATATMEVTYAPLTMTSQAYEIDSGTEHFGTLFFSIPDGSALSYHLYGKATAPTCAEKLTFSVPAKVWLTIPIHIQNWLKKQPQTFQVEFLDFALDPFVKIQGPKSVTIAAGGKRLCNLRFYCHREQTVSFAAKFVSDRKEYVYYDIQITVTSATVIETLSLSSAVRQLAKRVLMIENPAFDSKATKQTKIAFVNSNQWWSSSHPQILRVSLVQDINDRPEGKFAIEYRPLIHSVEPIEAFVTISFVELGEYKYKLLLTSQAPNVEQVLHFRTPLGISHTQAFNFLTYSQVRGDLQCTLSEANAFAVPDACVVEATDSWEGKTASVQVTFEPESIGEVQSTLVVQSESVGEYKCSLQGQGIEPIPQGPFSFTGTKDIEFRNVLSASQDFELVIDNPCFVLPFKLMTIPGKSSKIITIRVDSTHQTNTTAALGKLSIACVTNKMKPRWIYYLEASSKGIARA